jgi:hypothetical protein
MSMNFPRGAASIKATMRPPFALSPIKRMHAWWQYLWPFQSRKALMVTLCIQAGGSLVWAAIILLWLEPGALPWVLGGALIGGMYGGPCRSLPAKWTLTTRSDPSSQAENIRRLMLRKGYIVDKPAGTAGHVRYVHKWSFKKLTSWLSYDNEIDLYCRGNEIELHGPLNVLEWLYGRMAQQLMLR